VRRRETGFPGMTIRAALWGAAAWGRDGSSPLPIIGPFRREGKSMIRIAVLLGLGVAAPAAAQIAVRPDAATDPRAAAADSARADASDAEAIIVTATRAPTPIDRVAAAVTVIDKAAIDRNQDLGVTELLLRTPGVSFSRSDCAAAAEGVRCRIASGNCASSSGRRAPKTLPDDGVSPGAAVCCPSAFSQRSRYFTVS